MKNSRFWLGVSLVIQALILTLGVQFYFYWTQGDFPFPLNPFFFGGLLFFLYLGVAFFLIALVFKEIEKEGSFRTYLMAIEDFMISARSQRHDFVNHLQALYGLLKTNQFELAVNYITEIYGEVKEVSSLLRLRQPEVSALLYAKQGIAAVRGINFKIKADPDFYFPGTPQRFNRLLGNLIENAFDAVAGEEEKYVGVELKSTLGSCEVKVENSLSLLPEDLREIFCPGFTTKDSTEHQGMGLYVVRSIARQYQGKVSVSAAGKRICFTVSFPQGLQVDRVEKMQRLAGGGG